jgi:hypothetical protein
MTILDLDYSMIPEHCRDGVQRYIETGSPVGGFLQAVFENNLVEAFGRADDINRAHLWDYTMFLYNEAPKHPIPSWGSPQAYKEWLEMGGLAGLQAGRRPKRLSHEERSCA